MLPPTAAGQPSRRNSISERMRQKYKFGSELEEDESCEDLYKRLEIQESDLILAAELGSALLDKNEAISKQKEVLVVEYSQKLEVNSKIVNIILFSIPQVLEQEKYQLRRQLEVLEDEYQQEVSQLHDDINSVKKALERHSTKKKIADKRSSDMIDQLREKNQMMNLQVKKFGEKGKQLLIHKESVDTQIVVKMTNMQQHSKNIEGLNKKISEIVLAKVMLEKEINVLTNDIDSITQHVDISANKIRQMERKITNQGNTLKSSEKDCEKLRSSNQSLSSRLEKVNPYNSEIVKQTNLMLEIERSVPNYKESIGYKDSDDSESDDDEDLSEKDIELDDLKSEVLSVYQQVHNMCITLTRGRGRRKLPQSMQPSCVSSASSEDFQSVSVRIFVDALMMY